MKQLREKVGRLGFKLMADTIYIYIYIYIYYVPQCWGPQGFSHGSGRVNTVRSARRPKAVLRYLANCANGQKLLPFRRLKGLPIQELLTRVDTLETKFVRIVNYERGDSSAGSVAHIEEHVDVNTRVNLTMQVMVNQVSVSGAISVNRIKILEPKPFRMARYAKALENIFDIEQYFKATNTVTIKAKVMLATMHIAEDAKLWWRSQYVDIQERDAQ
ncbi:senescence-specific cysteine protease sag39 [Cucumis melo var. makuwa]|uniref:Senescence-specific cysteine protease sag39 n=1 Tax=Cucumis melo var. makuwa TaxID=1194695 RepID=A0A5A7TJP2_CUCMM|nr:senescence-specific cysteine protease sag39 [Cucumis melo var. makuwa]